MKTRFDRAHSFILNPIVKIYIPIFFMKTSFLSIVLLCSALVATLHARQVEVKLIYFNKPADAPEKFHLYVGTKPMAETAIPSYQFSVTMDIQGKGAFPVTVTDSVLEGQPEELQERLKQYPSVIIPEGCQKALLLAFQDSSQPLLPVRFYLLSADEPEFKEGDIRFVNLSQYAVAGTLGAKELKLKSHKSRLIRGAAPLGEEFTVRVDVIRPKSKMPRQALFYQKWKAVHKRKQVVFIYDLESGRTTYSSASLRGF